MEGKEEQRMAEAHQEQTTQAAPETQRAQGQHLTPQETLVAKDTFLRAFGIMGNVRAACIQANVSRETVYKWLKRDKKFATAYNEYAVPDSVDFLESEAFRRAVQGVEEPVISHGEVVYDDDGNIVTVKKYSDALLMFLLKARAPQKYRERPPQVEVTNNTITITEHKDRLLEKLRALPEPETVIAEAEVREEPTMPSREGPVEP